MAATPDLDNGFARIANGILESLARVKLPGSEFRIVMVIFRATYGWGRKYAEISNAAFSSQTGILIPHVVKSIKSLKNRHIIFVTKNGNRRWPTYSFNKRYWLWKSLPKMVTAKSELPKTVILEDPTFCIKEKRKELPTTSKKKKKKTSKIFNEKSYEYRLSSLLLSRILDNNPKFKKPNLQSWAKGIDSILRIDGRDPQDVARVIDWCQADDFWYKNILSTSKLRDQFDQLYVKMRDSKRGNVKFRKNVQAVMDFLKGDDDG